MRSFIVLLATLLTGVAGAADSATSQRLSKLFDDYFERSLQLSPLQATFIGDDRYDDKLTNSISPDFIRMALEVDRSYLDQALQFDPATLSEEDRLSWEIFVHERRISIESAKFPGELLPIDQMFSISTLMPVLASASSAQPFRDAKDYDRFLARMNEYITWSDQAITNMREGMRRRIVQPRVVMENVEKQLAALIEDDPQKSLFYAAVEKIPESVPAADRARIEKAYRDAIVNRINPAYRRLHEFVRDEYLPHTRSTVAWTALPDGAAWYAFLVKNSTTTDLTPDQIHELGLKEVARILREM